MTSLPRAHGRAVAATLGIFLTKHSAPCSRRSVSAIDRFAPAKERNCAVDAAGSVRGGVRRREKNYATDFVGPKASVRRSIKISLLHCLTT
jgi:hypothetical protein